VVLDWYSRYVLSWEISVTMEEGFCVSALESVLRRHGRPEVFNTDQGSQYTGAAFTGVLKAHQVTLSMDGKG
jgi:putative transposase